MIAGWTLTMSFNGLAVCYCYASPTGLHVGSEAWRMKVNQQHIWSPVDVDIGVITMHVFYVVFLYGSTQLPAGLAQLHDSM
jgi:hypothetical protein